MGRSHFKVIWNTYAQTLEWDPKAPKNEPRITINSETANVKKENGVTLISAWRWERRISKITKPIRIRQTMEFPYLSPPKISYLNQWFEHKLDAKTLTNAEIW